MAVAAFTGVVSERQYPAIEVRELTLVNGMRLAIKETDFLADEVLVTAVAVGGLSEVCTDLFQVLCCVWGVLVTAFVVVGLREVQATVYWRYCRSSNVCCVLGHWRCVEL
jgi:hypothetical protein